MPCIALTPEEPNKTPPGAQLSYLLVIDKLDIIPPLRICDYVTNDSRGVRRSPRRKRGAGEYYEEPGWGKNGVEQDVGANHNRAMASKGADVATPCDQDHGRSVEVCAGQGTTL